MVEVFITDMLNTLQAERLANILLSENTVLKINIDLNENELAFPCGHTILRIEGKKINSDKIIETVRNQGFNCEMLEDKICTQSENL